MRSFLGWLAGGAAIAVATSCTVEALDLTGKQCPCEEGWVCHSDQNVCVLAGSDSGVGGVGNSGGTGGSSGSGGSSGAGGCLSTQKLCNDTCVSTSSASHGCGSSGCDPCGSFLNSSGATCVSGECAPSCSPGFGNCDDSASNGCEEALDTLQHCGACDKLCSSANAAATSCVAGTCAPQCLADFADCSTPSGSTADDGCETNATTSSLHCGACGNACPLTQSNARQPCSDARCGCTTTAHCEGANGLQQVSCDSTTGSCICGGSACNHGELCLKSGNQTFCSCNDGTGCAANMTCCASPAGCFDLLSDANNCGACGRACSGTEACVNGECQP